MRVKFHFLQWVTLSSVSCADWLFFQNNGRIKCSGKMLWKKCLQKSCAFYTLCPVAPSCFLKNINGSSWRIRLYIQCVCVCTLLFVLRNNALWSQSWGLLRAQLRYFPCVFRKHPVSHTGFNDCLDCAHLPSVLVWRICASGFQSIFSKCYYSVQWKWYALMIRFRILVTGSLLKIIF